ncbi:DUF2807 domain-containing protein [Mucilaginibacter sp. BJC16-A38]|uniref:head GIN domain-containing protein n=1 Tax=Mucilaginibacter phenanthrenivorans TaxID=1234842 RepID=UPI00215887DD|nr:head GIN domain-containing protein [Mucilaginibacter phenanthrenivorans]MCR8559886.1 DUF2807 domain-containing protein [Mucilaginibacter phenanthrenivorans]
MKKLHFAILGLVAITGLGTLSACRMHCIRGSGNQITENRKVDGYTAVEVSDSFKVIIKQDSSSSSTLNITADDNIIKFIRTSVEGGRLHIYTRKNFCSSGVIVIKVPVHVLDGLKASDAAEIVADGKLNAQDITLHLSDGGRITIDLTAKHVNTHASDASELTLTGQASSNDIQISDGAKVYAKGFISGTSSVKASDGSFGEVNVLNTLNFSGSDGASLKYYGNPSSVNTNKSDGASVEKGN